MCGHLGRAVVTIAAILSLASGNLAMCAGWQPTPAARMACCDAEASCPTHTLGTPHSGGHSAAMHHAQTQEGADTCCAAAERHDATAAGSAFVLSAAAIKTVSPNTSPLADLRDHAAAVHPPAASPVPKHLLLSVFLV